MRTQLRLSRRLNTDRPRFQCSRRCSKHPTQLSAPTQDKIQMTGGPVLGTLQQENRMREWYSATHCTDTLAAGDNYASRECHTQATRGFGVQGAALRLIVYWCLLFGHGHEVHTDVARRKACPSSSSEVHSHVVRRRACPSSSEVHAGIARRKGEMPILPPPHRGCEEEGGSAIPLPPKKPRLMKK